MSRPASREPCRSATDLAAAVRDGHISAARITRDTLDAIERHDRTYNCFTSVTSERALREADSVDRALSSGRDPGPLAGGAVRHLRAQADLWQTVARRHRSLCR